MVPGKVAPIGTHTDERDERTWRTMATDIPAVCGYFPPNVLPEEIRQVDSVTTVNSAGRQHKNQGDAFTGLIIDATGLGVRPAMAPKIIDENGNEVYGTGYVSRDYAVQIGVVGYEKDLNRAKSNERVTDNPIVVKGIKASGSNKADIVISNMDASNVSASAKNLNFMEQCKVMIILD